MAAQGKVLIVGDSISMHYAPFVAAAGIPIIDPYVRRRGPGHPRAFPDMR